MTENIHISSRFFFNNNTVYHGLTTDLQQLQPFVEILLKIVCVVVGKIAYAGVLLGNIDEKFIYSRATIAKELLRRRSTSNPQLHMTRRKYNICIMLILSSMVYAMD